jgi:hypothetical protein
VIVEDLADNDEGVAGAVYTHLWGSPPAKFIPFLADAFCHQPRFRAEKVRRRVSDLFVHLKAGAFPEAHSALIAGVTDDDHFVQSKCALAVSRGPLEVQQRALEALAPFWRNHSQRETFRVVGAIRCALLFGLTLRKYADEFERLFLDPSVDDQIRGASAGAIFHAGLIGRGLDLLEKLDLSGKTILLRELRNVQAQRPDFLEAEPNQASRLRHTILSALRSDEVGLRQAALKALPSAFPEGLLAKNDMGEWDLNPEARASLEYIVANNPDKELVNQARLLLDPNQGLGWLIKMAEEREAVPNILKPIFITAIQSSNMETRKAALEALFPGGDLEEYMIVRSRDDYELNPIVEAALMAIATSDPDPSLRERATQALDPEYLDKIAAKVFRERERGKAKYDDRKQTPSKP